jgi:hypothetical protein
VTDQQAGQERLRQRLLDVEPLGDVEDDAARQQRHRGQPGDPLATPEPTGEQQEPGAGGGGGHRGPPRHRTWQQLVQDPQPVALGRQQRRDEVEHAGQAGQRGRHPAGELLAPQRRRDRGRASPLGRLEGRHGVHSFLGTSCRVVLRAR